MAILEKRAIGLDIGSDAVRVVELAQGRKGLRLINFFSKPIERKEGEEEKESVSRTLKELFKEKKIKGERVASALPLTSAVIRNIAFPFQDAGKIEKTIKFEAEPHLPFAVEEAIINFHITGEAKGNGAEVLMIAVDKKRVREHLDILSGAGIEPMIVSLDAIAIFNAYSLSRNEKERTVALVDMGVEKTTVAIISEGKLSFIRGIPQGSKDLTSALDKKKRISSVSILKEIERTFISSQARSGKKVEEIVLSGEGSRLSALREHFELDIEVSVYNLIQELEHRLDETLFPYLCVGVGLALEGLGLGKLSFNFRKEEFALRVDRARMKKSLIFPAVLVGGIVFLSLFSLFMNLHLREKRYQALNEKIESVFREVFPKGRVIRGMELELLRRKVEEEREKGEPLEKLTPPRLSSLGIIRELFLRIPEGEEVQLFSLRLRNGLLKIEGEVASFGAVNLLKRELEESPYFQKVSLTRARANSDGKVVRFALDIYLK
jgi:Tfp pilus assembly PilM family ATPase